MISTFANNATGANKTVSTIGNIVKLNFAPSIPLDDKVDYELRLISANIVYCMPNITSSNNTLTYIFGGTTHTITFDTGLYALSDINNIVSLYTGISNNGGDSNLIVFSADESTSKIYIFFSQPYVEINCGVSNSIMPMLGFPTSSGVIGGLNIASWIKGAYAAQLNSLQNILIQCDIVNGGYSNTQVSNVIAVVTPNVTPYSTIIYTPYFPISCPVFKRGKIDSITITLVDQDGNDIDMGTSGGTDLPAELWSVVLTLEPTILQTAHNAK